MIFSCQNKIQIFKKTPSKVTWRWWLCVLLICLGFHQTTPLHQPPMEVGAAVFSYFFLWSTKVMFRDNDENKTKMTITCYNSISSLSKNQKTEVWWKLLLSFLQWLDIKVFIYIFNFFTNFCITHYASQPGHERAMTMTGAEKKLAMSSQFHFHDDESWKTLLWFS